MEKKDTFYKIVVIFSFIVMILINLLSHYEIFGLRRIGEISDTYPTFLTPVGFSFSVWGVIYLLLCAFTVYQLGIVGKNRLNSEKEILNKARIAFILTSFLNAAWVIAWTCDYMALSVMLIIGILIALRLLAFQLSREYLRGREKLLIRIPFSIYFGWITLASVLNIIILMESVQWDIFGFSDPVRIVIEMFAITLVGTYWMLRNHDITYGLTLLWGFVGILVKHSSVTGWNGKYPSAIISTGIGIAVIIGAICYLLILKKREYYNAEECRTKE